MKLDTKWLGVILFAILALLFLYMAGFFTEKLPTEHDAKTNQIDVNNAETHQLMLTSEPVVREFPGVVVAEQGYIRQSRVDLDRRCRTSRAKRGGLPSWPIGLRKNGARQR